MRRLWRPQVGFIATRVRLQHLWLWGEGRLAVAGGQPMNITCDHKRAVDDPKYFMRIARKLTEAPKGAVTGLIFIHEADGGCCCEERYQTTLIRLLEASPRDVQPAVQPDLGDWFRS
jgi:hypothetical protein